MAIKLTVYLVSVVVALGAIGSFSFPLEEETQNLRLPEDDLYGEDVDRYLREHQYEEQKVFVPRVPRSVQPGGPRYPGGNNGNNRGGGVDVSVNRRRGVGTSVNARGEHTWTGNNGNTEVRVHGQYDRVIRGPQRGNRGYNVGAEIRHRW